MARLAALKFSSQPQILKLLNPLFSPRGEAKCVRGPSARDGRRSARGQEFSQLSMMGAEKKIKGIYMSISSSALAGITQALKQFDQAAEGIRGATQPQTAAADHLDLSTEAVKLLSARTAVEASLVVLKTADEINQHAIDLLA